MPSCSPVLMSWEQRRVDAQWMGPAILLTLVFPGCSVKKMAVPRF